MGLDLRRSPATILAYTSPALGNLSPIAALLAELRRRGHRIVLRTLTAGVPIGTAAGFEAAPVDPRIEAIPMTDWTARTGLGAIRTAFGIFAERAAFETADMRAAIEDAAPDAVIVDANCWGAPAVVEALGLPWASFWPYPPFLSSVATPPFGPGLKPMPGVFGRLRDAAVGAVTGRLIESSMLGAVNRIHAELGTSAVASSDDVMLRAPLVLVATAEPFEYAHPDWDERVVLVGPCELRAPGGAEIVDVDDRPTVLVTTSSERQRDDALPITTLTALADQPVHVVATFPCGVPDGLHVPPNATVRRYVDHGAILDRAVCAVTHGGMGVTQKALARGVPVCVVPYGRDQFEVARRVEVSRCGTRLPAGKLTEARLRSAVAEAMTMTAGAARVAAAFAGAGGAVRGADVVEQRLLGIRRSPAAAEG